MHRGVACCLLAALLGCASAPPPVQDASRVERLRLQITKARNAIAETQSALARARNTPFHAELEVRLAELLSEEARYHYQVAHEREQDAERTLHVPQVRFLKNQAIELYEGVLKREPGSPLEPRVLFNLGQEHRELGDYASMRAVLERLTQTHPTDPLASEALIILGDDAFDRGEMARAASAYQKITAGPPSRTVGLAWYKLGWVRVNEGVCKTALEAFTHSIEAIDAWAARGGPDAGPGIQAELDVRREALVDLTWCLSRELPPEKAVAYVRDLARDRGAYVAALERLADRFGLMDQSVGALDAERELLRLAPDGQARLDDARTLHAALRKSQRFEQVGDDVHLITEAMLRYARRPDVPMETRDRLVDEFEKYARDLATRAQAMVARPGTPARPNAVPAAQVAAAYRVYLEAFPASENRLSVLQNLADVLAESGQALPAARRSLQAGLEGAEGPPRQQALYDAVVQYQKALDQDTHRSALERVLARAGLRRAASELLVGTLPVDQARRVKFAIGQTDYDEGQLQAAIDRLTAVAFEYPGTPEGDAAVHLVLDTHKRRADWLGLVASGRRFLSGDSPVSPAVKQEIAPIVTAAEQRQLDELSVAAAGVDGGDVAKELRQFAERYQGTSLGERALLNAFVAARAEGDTEALGSLAEEIRSKYPQSKELSGILSTMARTAAARFEVDRAVGWFQQAASADPAGQATLRLAEGRLRAELADDAGARGAFQQAIQASEGSGRAQAAAALAAHLERFAGPAEVISALQPLAAGGDGEVLARLGLAQVRGGNPDQGEATLQRVLDQGSATSDGARARAWYGQAEALARTVSTYQPQGDVESVTELVTLIEVTEQAYLKAARQVDPVYTAAALGRLSFMAADSARRLRALSLPGGVADAVKQGIERRASQLEKTSTEALAACAELAWTRQVFHPAVRACLKGTAPAQDPVVQDRLAPRTPAGNLPSVEAPRTRLARNPEDLEALRALGEALLDAGDPHVARLVFARASQAGGGPLEANLLGIASFKAGDQGGAMEAFALAAAGGLEAGRQNLASALRSLGMAQAADAALAKWPTGRDGGRLLGGGTP